MQERYDEVYHRPVRRRGGDQEGLGGDFLRESDRGGQPDLLRLGVSIRREDPDCGSGRNFGQIQIHGESGKSNVSEKEGKEKLSNKNVKSWG